MCMKGLSKSKTCSHRSILEYWTVGYRIFVFQAKQFPQVVSATCSCVTMGCWTIASQRLWSDLRFTHQLTLCYCYLGACTGCWSSSNTISVPLRSLPFSLSFLTPSSPTPSVNTPLLSISPCPAALWVRLQQSWEAGVGQVVCTRSIPMEHPEPGRRRGRQRDRSGRGGPNLACSSPSTDQSQHRTSRPMIHNLSSTPAPLLVSPDNTQEREERGKEGNMQYIHKAMERGREKELESGECD